MHNQPFSQFDEDGIDRLEPIDPRRRLMILGVAMTVLLIAIGLRVVHVQHVLSPRFVCTWEELAVQDEIIPCRNGRILSRDGVVLASDEIRYDVAVEYRWLESPSDPFWLRQLAASELSRMERKDKSKRQAAEATIQKRREDLLDSLAELSRENRTAIDRRSAEIQRRVESMVDAVERRRRVRASERESFGLDQFSGFEGIIGAVVQELTTPPGRFDDDPLILKEELQPHVLFRDVPLEMVAAIQSQPSRFPGIHILPASTRNYPQADLAAHVVGIRRDHNISNGEGDDQHHQGESGVERAQDRTLRGIPGLERHWQDRRGQRVRSEQIREPQDGRDVTLTIDARLQQIAEGLLDREVQPYSDQARDEAVTRPVAGCLIAMDLWTGDVLTMATVPRASLKVLSHPTHEEWDRLVTDPRQPMFSRATKMALPPGSIFKVITAIAALQSGATTSEEIIHCRGYLDQPDKYRCLIFRRNRIGHGDLALSDALSQSCNVYFYEMARRMGPDVLGGWAERFGYGQLTGIDLPNEHPGALPRIQAQVIGDEVVQGATLQFAIGQGSLLVTPLQVVRMMSAIGNGGYLIAPHVVLDIGSSGRTEQFSSSRVQRIPGLSNRTLSAIRQGLEMAVQDERGTARSAQVAMLTLAGQAGTAEVSGKPDHAWFAGYAPAENPRVAFVVALEHGGESSLAATIARDFIIELLGQGVLAPFQPDRQDTQVDSPRPIDLATAASDTE